MVDPAFQPGLRSDPKLAARAAKKSRHLSSRLFGLDFLKDFFGHTQAVHCRRNPAINGTLEENLHDIVLAASIVKSTFYVQLYLVRSVKGGEHGQVKQTPGFSVQPWPGPDSTPAVLSNELL